MLNGFIAQGTLLNLFFILDDHNKVKKFTYEGIYLD